MVKWNLNIFELFPDVQFYDYTKNFTRHAAFSNKWNNYHLTFSLNEDNIEKALYIKENYDTNIAVVFRKELPKTWQAFSVIDGDSNDLRFTDKLNSIVGLKAKGKARKDFSGFVQ